MDISDMIYSTMYNSNNIYHIVYCGYYSPRYIICNIYSGIYTMQNIFPLLYESRYISARDITAGIDPVCIITGHRTHVRGTYIMCHVHGMICIKPA